MRILSLIASATEIICALGLEEQLVGRSHECDYPLSVLGLPQVTRPRFDVSGSSAEIDRRVKALLREGSARNALSVYEVFPERLDELRPTHIVTQTQCEVCAVSLSDVERAVEETTGCRAEIVALNPNSMPDIWEDFMRVASALGNTGAGIRLVAGLQARMDAIESRARQLAAPRVAVIEWVEPLMCAGNWTPELVRMAGGTNLFGEAGKHSPALSWDEVACKDPDVIVVSPCGFSLERALEDVPILTRLPSWEDLRAVREGRVFVADGHNFFNRPGPRLVETLEILAEILHPVVFDFGHRDRAFVAVAGS